MQIPLLDLKKQYDSIKDEVKAAIDEVLESTQYIMGSQVKDFEQQMAEYCNVKHAIGVASGTDALLIALKALGVGPGDEVIVPTFTFFATAGVVSRLGATPVFADIDPATYNISVEEIEKRITERTKVIIPVHLYGQMSEMEAIMALADKHNLAVVEDACQAIGTEHKGRKVGQYGHATAFSFFPSKNLGAYGDGGMVLTNDDKLAELMKRLRVHGSKPKYHHKYVGYNSRLDSLQAAILSVKVKYLDQWSEGRREVAAKYNQLFAEAGLSGLVTAPTELEHNHHVYHQYVIRVEDRDALQEYLKEKGVATSVYYPLCLHLQECYEDLGGQAGDLPVAEQSSQQVLALPIFPELTDEEIKYVVETIKKFYK